MAGGAGGDESPYFPRAARVQIATCRLAHFSSNLYGLNMSFNCDICGRKYSNKRNLCRHIKEKHDDGRLHFDCVIEGCKSKFIRRSYLSKHLGTVHKMNKKDAKAAASGEVIQPERVPLAGPYSPISDASNDAHPVMDASDDDEFEDWLDGVIERPAETVAAAPDEATPPPQDEPDLNQLYDLVEETVHGPNAENDVNAVDGDDNVDGPNVNDDGFYADDVIYVDADDDVDGFFADDNVNGPNVDDVVNDANDEDDVIYVSSEDEPDAGEDRVEYFNVTLKTVTHLKNGTVDSIDRIASVAYSHEFDPRQQDPMDVFTRIQEEFVEYMRYYQQDKH